MMMTTITTPIGDFHACADAQGLHRLLFPGCSGPELPGEPAGGIQPDTHRIFSLVGQQLNEYLQKKRRVFQLPLALQGTDFQQRVWNLLCEIPYGRTSTYGRLAEQLGSRNKARAVGGAAHVNPLPIIIPCHRLLGADGTLTGFAGGLKMKKYLLELEGFPGQH